MSRIDCSDEERNPLLAPATKNVQIQEAVGGNHTISFYQALAHLMKGNIGTGLLGLPFAVQHAGIVLGPVSLIIMGVICTLCMYNLVCAADTLSHRTGGDPTPDYGETAEGAFLEGPEIFRGLAKMANVAVNILLIITQLGFCCVYFIFMAKNLREIYVFFYGSDIIGVVAFIAMLFIPVLLLCFNLHYDHLTPFSYVAMVLTIIGLGIIYEYFFTNIPSSPDVELFADKLWLNFPIFFGSAIYSFEGIGVVLPLRNEMRKREDFWKVLLLGMTLVSIMYVSMGLFGYLTFGPNLHDTITLDLPSTPFYMVVRLMFVGAIFVTYAVQFQVPADLLWPYLQRKTPQQYHKVGVYLFRTVLVLFTMFLAMGIPQLANFISLIGAFSSTGLAIIFPALINELVSYSDGYSSKISVLRLITNVAVFIVGLIGMVTGTAVAIMNIIDGFQHP